MELYGNIQKIAHMKKLESFNYYREILYAFSNTVKTNISFNDGSDGTSFVLYRSIHGCKILHCSEENTSDQNPQKYRKPSKDCCLDWSVDRACSCDRCELMTKYDIRICRHIIYAVFQLISRSLCIRVNSPFLLKISSIEKMVSILS